MPHDDLWKKAKKVTARIGGDKKRTYSVITKEKINQWISEKVNEALLASQIKLSEAQRKFVGEEARYEVQRLMRDNQRALKRQEQLLEDRRKMQAAVRQLKSRVESKDGGDVSEGIQELQGQIQNLLGQIDELENEKRGVQDRSDELERTNRRMLSELQDLKNDMDRMSAEKVHSEANLELETELDRLRSERDELAQALDQRAEMLKSKNSEIEQLHITLGTIQEKMTVFEDEEADKFRELEKAHNEAEQLKQQLAQALEKGEVSEAVSAERTEADRRLKVLSSSNAQLASEVFAAVRRLSEENRADVVNTRDTGLELIFGEDTPRSGIKVTYFAGSPEPVIFKPGQKSA